MTSLNLALSTRRCVHEISRKRRSMNSKPSSKGKKRPKGSGTSLNKASSKTKCVFEIGPPAWIKKEINTCSIENALYLPPAFCQSVGIWEPCMVTLKTSMSSTRSWQARVAPYKHSSHHVGGSGWKRFCQENRIKVGDVCTINILETTLWHVVITYALGPDSTCTSVPLCDGDGEKNE
uniref:TF-B3 domain-containing protein n=1 Tax=Arundo donax TaxID=35708 RepID=A0A0A9GJT6_ARUDO